MTTDLMRKEKAFLESLKADTGRDLRDWMSAIGAQNLNHRNDTIDWLREQGFIFSRASWLERIFHNGGRPIYLTELPPDAPNEPTTNRPQLRIVASNPEFGASTAPTGRPPEATIRPVPAPASNVASLRRDDTVSYLDHARQRPDGGKPADEKPVAGAAVEPFDTVEAVVAKGKAFQPLALHFLRELRTSTPRVDVSALKNVVTFGAPKVFGALVISPKGLRLCLDLGSNVAAEPFDQGVVPSRVAKLPPTLTHMVTLDDARQIDEALMAQVKVANSRVNG